MRAFSSDHHPLPLPPGHRFPLAKYRLLRQAVAASGLAGAEGLHAAAPATDEELLRVHTPDYLRRVTRGELEAAAIRRLGFPWSPELVARARGSVGGTLAACRAALEEKCAFHLAGGTHHAFADRGEGFCLFNDVAVAARALQAEGRVRRVAIVDCDVHQGNGTAAIFQGDDSVFTLSLHGRSNYPFVKQPGDLEIGLEDGTGDREYLEALDDALPHALAPTGTDLAIYLAGADPFVGDRFGRLALTREGLAARDRLVFAHCRARAIPVAVVMAGGYAAEVRDVVGIHLETFRAAVEAHPRHHPPAAPDGGRRGR